MNKWRSCERVSKEQQTDLGSGGYSLHSDDRDDRRIF